MIKLIRRNQKTVLTGLTIFSMIAFVAQRGSSGQGSSADPLYGTMIGKKIYGSDLAQGKAEVTALTHAVRFTDSQSRSQSILDRLFGADVAQAMGSKPELFVMLADEADAADIQVSKDEVGTLLVNAARDPNTGGPLDPDSDLYAATKAGISDALKIEMRFQQVLGAIKVSKPMRDLVLARFGQTLEMNLVQINAGEFLNKVPAPTTQQVQDQFKQFKDELPRRPTPTTNPFGFGYKLPMRSKLQYLRLSADAVNAAVVATRSAYDWEVAARKYYLKNPGEFSLPGMNIGTSTQPSNLPAVVQTFDQARDKVLQAIRQPLSTALMEQVQGYLTSTLNSDYQAYLKFAASNPGAAEPDSSLGVRYSSFSYISKLIDIVQNRFKVAIVGSETPGYLSTAQIGEIPGVGSISLTDFVDKQSLAYLNKVNLSDPTAPAFLLKPAPVLSGSDDKTKVAGIVFARITAVLPSAAPATSDEVSAQVEADLKTAEAYKLAQAQAALLQTAAKAGDLALAALAMGRPVIPVQGDNAFAIYTNDIKGILPPLGDSAPSFTKQAFDMTAAYDPHTNPHPTGIIGLPEQTRVFAGQITNVNAVWTAETYFMTVKEFEGEATRPQTEKLREGWFGLEAVSKRLGFKSSR